MRALSDELPDGWDKSDQSSCSRVSPPAPARYRTRRGRMLHVLAGARPTRRTHRILSDHTTTLVEVWRELDFLDEDEAQWDVAPFTCLCSIHPPYLGRSQNCIQFPLLSSTITDLPKIGSSLSSITSVWKATPLLFSFATTASRSFTEKASFLIPST